MKHILQRLLSCRRLATLVLLWVLQTSISNAQNIRYVDASKSAGAGQDGTTWAKAFPTLREATDLAWSDFSIKEIHVAKGTYYPTGEQSGTDRDRTFGIGRIGLKVLGGFPTGGGIRDWVSNLTILSGEIGDPNTKEDNSRHVMVIARIFGNLNENTLVVVDGFTIQSGYATGGGTTSYNGVDLEKRGGAGIAILGDQDYHAGQVRIMHCVIRGNYASNIGAGLYVQGTRPLILSCVISGNYANYGGGIMNMDGAMPQIANCTIAGNHSNNNGGGGIRNSGNATMPSLRNTIVYGNSGRGIENTNGADYHLDYSLVQGVNLEDGNNISGQTNPQFINPLVTPGLSLSGDYRLMENSPCIDKGYYYYFLDYDTQDVAGNFRYQCGVDMGAYEFAKNNAVTIQSQPIDATACRGGNQTFRVAATGALDYRWQVKIGDDGFVDINDEGVYSGAGTATLTITNVSAAMTSYKYRCVMKRCEVTATSNTATLTVNPAPEITSQPGPAAFCLGSGTSITIQTNHVNGYQWQVSTGGSFSNITDGGIYSGTKTATLGFVATAALSGNQYRCVVTGTCSPAATVTSSPTLMTVTSRRYVREGGTGSGLSWNDASGDLQKIIDASCPGGEVWVAAGTFKPKFSQPGYFLEMDKAFVLKKDVKIYGGFAGTELTLNQRNLSLTANRSTLSGDLDGSGSLTIADAHHVVIGAGELGTAVLDGFTITGGNAVGSGEIIVNGQGITKNDGGGIFIRGTSSIKLFNLRVLANRAGTSGGGVFCSKSSPTLEHVIMEGNTASYSGAFHNHDSSSPQLTNVTMSGNKASEGGGAMYNSNSSANLLNVLMSENSAPMGGAVCNYNSSPVLTNVTIVKNTATFGGAVYNSETSSPKMRNSVVWGNSSGIGRPQAGYLYPTYHYSWVQDLTGSDANGNLDSRIDPMFVNAAGGDYSLGKCSPLVNKGNNSYLPAAPQTDIAGKPRIYNNKTVDIGAYEHQSSEGVKNPVALSQTFCSSRTVADLVATGNELKWYTEFTGGSPLSLQTALSTKTYYVSNSEYGCEGGIRLPVSVTMHDVPKPAALSPQNVVRGTTLSELLVTGSNLKWYESEVGISPKASTTEAETKTYFVGSSPASGGCQSDLTRIEVVRVETLPTRYVKSSGSGDGSSWEKASSDLQAMINLRGVAQVWVSGHTYTPRTIAGNGSGNRDKAFVLKKDVKIYGGFAGTELTLSQRNLSVTANRSTLSGDLDGSSSLTDGDAYHVVIGAGDLGTAILDGFTITGGNASGTGEIMVNGQGITKKDGGGIFIRAASSLLFSNVIIQGNSATTGGGIFNYDSNPTLTNVLITGNSAQMGGAVYNNQSSPVLRNVTMVRNNAVTGGAMYNAGSSRASLPEIRNSVIWGNSSGIYVKYGNSTCYYSLVQGLTTSDANGNLDSRIDPMFVNAAGGDYSLGKCSPLINKGNNADVPEGLEKDIAGNTRIHNNSTVDIGAYEYQSPVVVAGTQTFCVSGTVADLVATGNELRWFTLITGGSSLTPETVLTSKTYYLGSTETGCASMRIPVNVKIFNIEKPAVVSSQNVVRGTTLSELLVYGTHLHWYESAQGGSPIAPTTEAETKTYFVSQAPDGCQPARARIEVVLVETQPIRYAKASGTGDGSSWERAGSDLQGLIDSRGVEQVWVSGGIYKPVTIAGNGTETRDKAFVINNIKLYGGFAGIELTLDQRDLSLTANRSTLSGDLDGSGTLTNEDAYHVVIGAGVWHAVLDGFTITGGNANGQGYTIVNGQDIPKSAGGGMFFLGQIPSFVPIPVLSNVIIQGNFGNEGGAMYNYVSNPRLTNVLISGNSAFNGGGMYNNGSAPALKNVTITRNDGSAMHNTDYVDEDFEVFYAEPVTQNSVIWGNSDGSVRFWQRHVWDNFRAQCSYSLVEGGTITGERGNLDGSIDPMFVNLPPLNPVPFIGGDYSLEKCSPLINKGYNAYVAAGIEKDIAGNPRIYNNKPVDIGAYEHQSSTEATDKPVALSQTFCGPRTVADLVATGNELKWYTEGGSPLSAETALTTKTYYVTQTKNDCESGRVAVGVKTYNLEIPVAASPQNVVMGTALSELVVSGSNVKWYETEVGGSPIAATTEVENKIYFVNNANPGCESARASIQVVRVASLNKRYVTASGSGDGSSWERASSDLQAMINIRGVEQVWVSRHTYTPRAIAGNGSGNRDKAFVLKKDVKIYGGFAGTELTLSQRDLSIASNRSTLSGDLDGSGTLSDDDAHHVVIGAGDLGSAVLDGFTITGGNASGTGEVMVNGQGITKNDGGGIFIKGASSLKLTNLSVLANRASTSGGGVFCWKSSPTLEHVIMEGNTASYSGAFHNYDMSFPHLTHVTMGGNNASEHGGAMYNSNSSAHLLHVHIRGNTAKLGGGIYNNNSSPTLTNVLISGNTADLGGAVYNLTSSPVLTNVTIARNTAVNGGAMFNDVISSPEMRNSVFWGNSSGVQGHSAITPICYNSLVQGVTTSDANGNLDGSSNPMFVNTAQDDYRLQPCSPLINKGTAELSGMNLPETDIASHPRIQLGRIDMGAYEANSFTDGRAALVSAVASTASAYQLPLSTTWYAADCNKLLLSVVSSGSEPVQGITHAQTWIGAIDGFVQRHYEITPENNATKATGKITLYFTQADFDAYNKPDKPMLPKNGNDVSGISNFRVQKRSGTSTDNSGLPASYDPGTLTDINPVDTDIVWNTTQSRWEVSFDVTGFSGFFAYAVENNPLPVTLVNFNATPKEQTVQLKWQTTSEVNASHFEIERSGNGKTWETLGSVDAIGDGPGTYEYVDASPLSNVNYYRLKMVDRAADHVDGNYSYSRIVSVRISDHVQVMQVSVYPNPATSGTLTVTTSGTGTPDVTIYDILGRKVVVKLLRNTRGSIDLDVSDLSVGTYLISVRKGEEQQVQRFVVN